MVAEGDTFSDGEQRYIPVLTERGGQHGGFTDAGLRWLAAEGAKGNFSITEINNARNITEAYLCANR